MTTTRTVCLVMILSVTAVLELHNVALVVPSVTPSTFNLPGTVLVAKEPASSFSSIDNVTHVSQPPTVIGTKEPAREQVMPFAAESSLARTTISYSGHALSYFIQPNEFVKVISDCLDEPGCSMQYLHMRKTGGTTVEHRFLMAVGRAKDFPAGSCCGATIVEMFNRMPETYCSAKFASYQVGFGIFANLMRKCRTKNKGKGRRLLRLITIREPIQMVLSMIHQFCNKNLSARSQKLLAACRRCSFTEDQDFWMKKVANFNKLLLKSSDVFQEAAERNETLLILENNDLDRFFRHLDRVSTSHNFSHNATSNRNVEMTNKCDFHMPSTMMKALRNATAIYRNLSLGLPPSL